MYALIDLEIFDHTVRKHHLLIERDRIGWSERVRPCEIVQHRLFVMVVLLNGGPKLANQFGSQYR